MVSICFRIFFGNLNIYGQKLANTVTANLYLSDGGDANTLQRGRGSLQLGNIRAASCCYK